MKVGEVDWGDVAKGPKGCIRTDIGRSQWGVLKVSRGEEGSGACPPFILPSLVQD